MDVSRPPSYRTTAIIVASALFMEQLDGTVLATALPTMARTFSVSPLHMSTALTSYLLALAMFIPASGFMADRHGAKKTFRLAILVFTLGSIACGQATSLPFLVAARFLQGAGGAMMVPVGRLVLLRSVAKEDMVSAMSWFMVPALLGPVVGPPLGGWIVTFASWRWIFLLNVPIGILGMALVTRYIPDFKEPPAGPFDARGFVLSSLALSCLVFGLEVGARREGVPLAWTFGILAFGAAMAVAYLVHEKRTEHPLLDLSLLRIPTFGISVAGGALTRITGGALPFLLPLMLQVGFGVSAARSGLITFSTAVGSLLMKLTAPPILRRFGFRDTLVWNALIASTLLAVCAAFRPGWPLFLVNALLLVGGFFQSLQYTALNTVAYADVPQSRMSLATSLYSTCQQLMLSMGICVATLVLSTSTHFLGHSVPRLTDFSVAFLVVTAISLLASPVCAILPRDAGAAMTGHLPADPAPE